MNKITKQDRKLISKVAKSLPKMYHKDEKVKHIVHGSAILDKNPLATVGTSSQEVQANKKYISGEVNKEVNHRKALEKMFLQHGDVGIALYQKQILSAFAKTA